MKTSKFSTNKKIMASASMLLLSTFMLSSATYAWFTMNRTVTVNGMEVRTKVGSNLLIAEDSYNFATITDNQDAKYKTAINQSRMALLEPSSTIDGINYWYTVEAAANGAKLDGKNWIAYNENAATALENDVAGKMNYDPQFNLKYGQGGENGVFADAAATKMTTGANAVDGAAYGYIDYSFYLKATSDAANQKVVMSKCNLLHNGAALGTDDISDANINDRAWRVAMFVESATANTDIAAAPSSGLVTVLAPASATNQTPGKAVDSATTVDTVSNANANANVGTIATAGTTAYYKVTVRLWLEGEDTTCTSETYAKLTSDYTLDLQFDLVESSGTGVTEIGSVVPSNG